MATKRLTAAMVERISPPAKGQVEYWDRSMPGFGLRVSYKGRKAWVVLSRLHGKLIRVTIGEWPIMTVAQAHAIGLTIPDPDLVQDSETGDWKFGEIDWSEFKRVLAGDGPCNRERLAARNKAHDDGAWVRAAAEAYAAKRATAAQAA